MINSRRNHGWNVLTFILLSVILPDPFRMDARAVAVFFLALAVMPFAFFFFFFNKSNFLSIFHSHCAPSHWLNSATVTCLLPARARLLSMVVAWCSFMLSGTPMYT